MKFFKRVLPLSLCAAFCAVAFAGCKGESTLLCKPLSAAPLGYEERAGEDFRTVASGAESFAAEFASAALKDADTKNNYAVSPVSVYMALSVAAACAGGDTRGEILSALGVEYSALENGFSDFYRSVVSEDKSNLGKLTGVVLPTNSVWLNKGTAFRQDCLQMLAEKYYSYSYTADFRYGNTQANLAVGNFVKEQTRGNIDVDFNLSPETLFTVLNTLYLKDVWNDEGDKLPLTEETYDFSCADGASARGKLMQGYYFSGRAYETERYSAFFTMTNMNLKIKFIVPRDGYVVGDIFTAETLAEVNAIGDYGAYDHENRLHYHTRCLFPEYAASYDGDVKDVLRQFGLNSMFEPERADFSSVSDDRLACGAVRHLAKLKVTRRGIEGSAAVVLPMAGSAGPGEYENVYRDFAVDRAFGFLVTNSDDTTLFSGIVNKI